MTEFLGFIDDIGRTNDGKYIYRFDFTTNKDVLWGEYFNIVPAAIVPDLKPDINSLSSSAKVIFPVEMIIAKKNPCYSMQDCIDGIIAMGFFELNEQCPMYNQCPLFFSFGEEIDEVSKKIESIGCHLFDKSVITRGNDEAINNLITNIANE